MSRTKLTLALRKVPRVSVLGLCTAVVGATLLGVIGCEGQTRSPKAPTLTIANPPPPVAMMPTIRETPDAPFRQEQPKAAAAVAFAPPTIESFHLKNGIRVLFVSRRELPIVAVNIVASGGAGEFGAPGELSALGTMLEQGTKSHSALELSDAFESLGASHEAWGGWDAVGLSAKSLTSTAEATLGLLAEMVREPAFDDTELKRLVTRRVVALQQEQNSPGSIAANVMAPVLFGRTHPYGHSLLGVKEDASTLSSASLGKLHHAIFSPERLTISLVGDIDRATASAWLEKHFGNLPRKGRTYGAAGRALAPAPGRLFVVPKVGAPQTLVLVADFGITATDTDRDAVEVMNTILGGSFSSRINMNLREKNAYTYGARSGFSSRLQRGPFTISAAVVADKTIPAVKEVWIEVLKLRSETVSDDELAAAKESIALSMPGHFEMVGSTAGALADLALYNRPLSDYATKAKRIAAITGADVLRVAQKYLRPDQMKLILVGDLTKFDTDLPSLGLGAATTYSTSGDPVSSAPH